MNNFSHTQHLTIAQKFMGKIDLYTKNGEHIRASVYRKIIDTSTAAGKSEELGLAEVIDDNGEHINVIIEGDDIEFQKITGEKLYQEPPKS